MMKSKTKLNQEICKILLTAACETYFSYSFTTIVSFEEISSNLVICYTFHAFLQLIWFLDYGIHIESYLINHYLIFHCSKSWNSILGYTCNKIVSYETLGFLKLIPMTLCMGIKFIIKDKYNILDTGHISFKIIAVLFIMVLSFIALLTLITIITLCVYYLRYITDTGMICDDLIMINKAFKVLPTSTVGPIDNWCSICYDDETTTENQQWVVLTCNHKFHSECIDPWIKSHNTCPLCSTKQFTCFS